MIIKVNYCIFIFRKVNNSLIKKYRININIPTSVQNENFQFKYYLGTLFIFNFLFKEHLT